MLEITREQLLMFNNLNRSRIIKYIVYGLIKYKGSVINMEKQYYMIYNTKTKQWQFPSIFCKTAKEAEQRLFRLLGNDARKYRFETRKVSYSEGKRIQEEIRKRQKVKNILAELPRLQEHQAYTLLEKYGGE